MMLLWLFLSKAICSLGSLLEPLVSSLHRPLFIARHLLPPLPPGPLPFRCLSPLPPLFKFRSCLLALTFSRPPLTFCYLFQTMLLTRTSLHYLFSDTSCPLKEN